MRDIKGIVVHCAATRPDWWASRSLGRKVKEIRRWHVEGRGWRDIGYHFLIDRDGKVAEGRPVAQVGAHVIGHNKGTIGVCLLGGHGSSENDQFGDHFTPEQGEALRGLIDQLKSDHGDLWVDGHNSFAAKACPGFRVKPWLDQKAPRKLAQSSTLGAGVVSLGSVTTAGAAIGQLSGIAQIIVISALCIAALGVFWMMRERVKKWAAGVR